MSDKPRKRIMRQLKINEISAVDIPAMEGAKAVMLKRADQGIPKTDENGETVEKSAFLTTADNGHAHVGLCWNGEGSGETGYVNGHSHPWIRLPDGTIRIAEVDGHTHEVSEFGMHGVSPSRSDIMLAHTSDGKSEASGTPVEEENLMTDKVENASDLEARIADLEKKLADAEAAEKAASEAAAALEAEKASELEKAVGEEVVYKAADGTVYVKSDDARLVEQAKRYDELAKKLAASEEKAAEADLRKRAESLAHIPGDEATRMVLVKSVDGIQDEEARAKAWEALVAKDAAAADAFVTKGHAAPAGAHDDASAELDKLAKSYAKEHDVSVAIAYDEVLKTAKGQELYAQSV